MKSHGEYYFDILDDIMVECGRGIKESDLIVKYVDIDGKITMNNYVLDTLPSICFVKQKKYVHETEVRDVLVEQALRFRKLEILQVLSEIAKDKHPLGIRILRPMRWDRGYRV
jgi:hypothetical protein